MDAALAEDVPAGDRASWGHWNWLANALLARHDAVARKRLLEETGNYVAYAREHGQPWGLPAGYVWASLHRWMDAANACRIAARITAEDAGRNTVYNDVLDYNFGRNNWGVSYIFSQDLPNSLKEIYSPAYHLLERYPTGAISEGPGARDIVERMRRYWSPMENNPLERFDTPTAIFEDYRHNFVCQESTINGQAAAVLFFVLADG